MDYEKLKKILDEHRLWLDSGKKKGKKANLINANLIEANLRGADLHGAYLSGADLSGAYLSKADLCGAELRGADLSEAYLDGADLRETGLIEAVLREAKLRGAKLPAAKLHLNDLRGAILGGAYLIEANLSGADLSEADLHGAYLRGADLSEADLSGAIFFGANLEGAVLLRTNLARTNLTGAILKDITIVWKDLNQIPNMLKAKYGDSFRLIGWPGTEDFENIIIRSIEFPPEYHKAGIAILNYFGTVLRKKYPEQKAKIRIEQEDLKVTMIIDPLEGDREVIEQALDEYGLVIQGKKSIDDFTNDPIQVIELKNELRIAKVRIESQKELLQYQNIRVDKLLSIVGHAVQNPSHTNIQIEASPKSEAHISQEMQFVLNVSPMIQ